MHAAAIAVVGAMLVFALNDWRRYAAIASMPFILNMVVKTRSRGRSFPCSWAGSRSSRSGPEARACFMGWRSLACSPSAMSRPMRLGATGAIESAVRQDADIDNSAEGRIAQIKAGVVMFMNHPFGVGHRGFAVLSSTYLNPIYGSVRRPFLPQYFHQCAGGTRNTRGDPVLNSCGSGYFAPSCSRGWAKTQRPLWK